MSRRGILEQAATRRLNRGRGHTYLLDGEQVPGVTSIVNDGVPKPALVNWAANTTAGYAIDHWHELAELKPSERLAVLQRARWEETDKASNRGTQVHALAQQLAAGAEVTVPEELAGHVDAYLQFAGEWRPRELLTEAVVVNRRWRYMGTLDILAELADGWRWLLDLKTGKGVYAESALQLAAYANCDSYLSREGEELPLPEIDAYGVVHLRADGYQLVPVAADAGAFRVFLHAQQVALFAAQPPEALLGQPLEPPQEAA